MNWLQTLVNGVLCERFTLLTVPWLMFFKAPVTPAEPWSFSTGMATILLSVLVTSLPRCERNLSVILGVVAVRDQVHPDERVVDRNPRSDRARNEGKSSLNWLPSGSSPPQRMPAGRILW